MAEEQIDKLTIAVETVGGDNKSIAAVRRQLEKLGRVDLSETIRQLGNLRAALGHLGTVDDSVKSMLDNMAKLGLRANGVSSLKRQLDEVGKSATQTKEEIAEVIDRAMQMQGSAMPSSTAAQTPRSEPITSPKAYGYDQSAIDAIDRYAEALDSTDKKHRANKKSAQEMGDAAEKAGNKATAAMQKTERAAKQTQKTTSKLADAFVRIVRFKIVASVLQNVIQSAKEGTTALGEFDAEFKQTLNTYSAASKAVGGSFALTLAPALEAAVPLIEYIADGIGSIGNSISAITAAIKGDSQYRAVKSVEQIKKELAASEESAKNVKQLISGFDELNIFSKQNDDKPDIDIYEWKSLKDEMGGISDALVDDLENLGKFAALAGGTAAVVALLKNAFSGKNKTLKEQTDLTKEDVKETVKLKDVVNALVPSVNGVTSALGILGGMALPALDPSGILIPAGEAAGALDVLGAKQPAPVIDTAPLLEGVGAMDARVKEFVTAEYAPVNLSASDKQLVEDLRAATEQVIVFAEGLSPAFDTEFGEIKQGYGNLMGGMQDMSKRATGAIDVTFGTAFAGIESDWAKTMGSMLDLALTAFDNVELMWNSAIADMQTAWDRQFGGGLSVNVAQPQTAPTAATSTTGRTTTEAVKHLFGEDGMKGASLIFGTKTDDATAQKIGETIAIGAAVGGVGSMVTDLAGAAAGLAGASGGIPKLLNPFRKVGAMANGGLVTSGEVFIARENGMPEFVGSFGGQTGVANNEQIVSGIAGGVESALAAYIPQIIRAIEENAATVNIGDDQIARAAQRGNRRYIQTTGHSMF